jgi:hypothetical protein
LLSKPCHTCVRHCQDAWLCPPHRLGSGCFSLGGASPCQHPTSSGRLAGAGTPSRDPWPRMRGFWPSPSASPDTQYATLSTGQPNTALSTLCRPTCVCHLPAPGAPGRLGSSRWCAGQIHLRPRPGEARMERRSKLQATSSLSAVDHTAAADPVRPGGSTNPCSHPPVCQQPTRMGHATWPHVQHLY